MAIWTLLIFLVFTVHTSAFPGQEVKTEDDKDIPLVKYKKLDWGRLKDIPERSLSDFVPREVVDACKKDADKMAEEHEKMAYDGACYDEDHKICYLFYEDTKMWINPRKIGYVYDIQKKRLTRKFWKPRGDF